jgi:hypothetical protein
MNHVSPVSKYFAKRQSSFWYIASYPVAPEVQGGLDECCEEIFSLHALSEEKGGVAKPKEQLRVGNSVVLISKYRRVSSTTTPPPQAPLLGSKSEVSVDNGMAFDDATIQAFASLSQLIVGTEYQSVQSSGLGIDRPPSSVASNYGGNMNESTNSSKKLSQEEVREAAVNVIDGYNNRTIGGPMASTMRGLAEKILTMNVSSAAKPAQNGPLLSSLLSDPPTPWESMPVPTSWEPSGYTYGF